MLYLSNVDKSIFYDYMPVKIDIYMQLLILSIIISHISQDTSDINNTSLWHSIHITQLSNH